MKVPKLEKSLNIISNKAISSSFIYLFNYLFIYYIFCSFDGHYHSIGGWLSSSDCYDSHG